MTRAISTSISVMPLLHVDVFLMDGAYNPNMGGFNKDKHAPLFIAARVWLIAVAKTLRFR
jgi:hypothetical protein